VNIKQSVENLLIVETYTRREPLKTVVANVLKECSFVAGSVRQ
jgi:hypothetical protein